MIFIPDNINDIQRYYKNTFVKFKETGDTLFYIRDIDYRSVRGTDETGTEFELFLSEEHPYEVDYVLPHKSYFQHNKRACLLQRIPAKQYRRGICSENVKITSIGRNGSVVHPELSFELLKAFVGKQSFPSFASLMVKKSKSTSIALSPRFCYVPDSGYILADLTAIAVYDKEAKILNTQLPIFKDNLVKLMGDSGVEVVCA